MLRVSDCVADRHLARRTTVRRTAAHRRLDRRHVYHGAGGLRKRVALDRVFTALFPPRSFFGRCAMIRSMNTPTLAQLETRLHRVERQNRLLIALLCTTAGLALIGAIKGSGNVITADEIRTQRLYMINDKGNVVHQWAVHVRRLV
jgi:hypothetical protein